MTSRAPQRSLPAPTIREESLKKTVEDQFIMKNFILITTLAMLTGAIVLIPLNAQAQSTPAQNAPAQDQKQTEFLGTWHEACSKKDAANVEKCCQLSKEMIEKYPGVEKQYLDYATKTAERCKYGKASDKFNAAITKYFGSSPDANNLDALLTAGDDFLELETDPQSPNRLYVLAQQALAARQAVVADVYKNYDRVKIYADRALKAYETLSPPEKYKKEYTDLNLSNLRDLVLANMNQCLAFILFQTKPDQPEAQDQALAYIDKSIKVRSQEYKEIGWKDPTNYDIRRNIYLKRYSELRQKYDPLPDDQKTGDTGKELLKQINQLLDTKLIPEDARVIATATRPEFKDTKTDAMNEFESFWKFRVDDPSKAPAYLKSFEADPTVEGPPVPVKADDGTGALAPNVTGGTSKLGAGAAATSGTGTSKTNGTKATGGKTPTKGSKTTTPSRRRKR
jgi:hypothetical protein